MFAFAIRALPRTGSFPSHCSRAARELPPLLLLVVLVLLACPDARAQTLPFEFRQVFTGVRFASPVGISAPLEKSNRLFVVEHQGLIKSIEIGEDSTKAAVFLDLSDRIANSPYGELYAIAFHPDYAENGHFFVRYKLLEPHRTVLSRFTRSASDSLVADPASEVVLFEVETPGNSQNHHGGDLAFGPDGYLYVPLGDGGVHLDPDLNAQDMTQLLGKVLRLDVDRPANGLNYGIPADNPYAGNGMGWREEIYAAGFRNPWRLTVDPATGDVWVADVGEVTWEEVNLVVPGGNYGWPIMEGAECFGAVTECEADGMVLPVHAYPREEGQCIIGGHVYRGSKIPELNGAYIYTDHTERTLWALSPDGEGGHRVEVLGQVPRVTAAFGADADGELYLANIYNGSIFSFFPAKVGSDREVPTPVHEVALETPFPNPMHSDGTVRFRVGSGGPTRLLLTDILGRELRTVYEGTLPFGAQRDVALDVGGLSPGVYFCVLTVNGVTRVEKVVVAR